MGDDQAEYSAATSTITVRLGTGASQSNGGVLVVNATTTAKFRVTFQSNYVVIPLIVKGSGVTSGIAQNVTDSVIINTICSNSSAYCDAEGAINATCDASGSTEMNVSVVCTCPGNYVQVNKVCQWDQCEESPCGNSVGVMCTDEDITVDNDVICNCTDVNQVYINGTCSASK